MINILPCRIAYFHVVTDRTVTEKKVYQTTKQVFTLTGQNKCNSTNI